MIFNFETVFARADGCLRTNAYIRWAIALCILLLRATRTLVSMHAHEYGTNFKEARPKEETLLQSSQFPPEPSVENLPILP